jgi:hypothetical protein
VKKASVSPLQSVGVLRGTGAAWRREPNRANARSNPRGSPARKDGGTHLGLRRNASSFAGRRRNRRPSDDSPRVRAEREPSGACTTRARGFSVSRGGARTTNEVRGPVRGGASPQPERDGEPSLESDRSPRRSSSEENVARLVSPCRPREGTDEGEGEERFVTCPCRTRNDGVPRSVPVHRLFAEVGSTPSGSEKRATCRRPGRKPGSARGAREREPDHPCLRTRERPSVVAAKGGRHLGGAAILIT